MAGLKPYDAVQLAGRDIYIREGCYNCHSQMIRPFQAETERYGHYSVAGEFVYDHPFQWGRKRTRPDLARVGGRYSDEWHRVHLLNPRDVVPESNMPAYYWLTAPADASTIEAKMRVLRIVGVPYTEVDLAGAAKALEGLCGPAPGRKGRAGSHYLRTERTSTGGSLHHRQPLYLGITRSSNTGLLDS